MKSLIYYFLIISFLVWFLSSMQLNQNEKILKLNIQEKGDGYYIAQFKIPQLSIFSYYVESEGETYLIDPPLDLDVLKKKAEQRGAKIKYVLLTHYPIDYLTGHALIDVPVIMGPESKKDKNSFELKQFKDGQSFMMGKIKTTLIHTPGHTIQSSCFLLQKDQKDICLFTGDTLFLGDVGRPNAGDSKEYSNQQLAGKLFDSLQKLKKLNPMLKFYPGHGAGSICGKAIHKGDSCILQNQFQSNYFFSISQKQQFVRKLLSYHEHSSELLETPSQQNKIGIEQSFQDLLKSALKPLSIQQFKRLSSLYTVIDTRTNAQSTGLIKYSYWLPTPTIMLNWIQQILKPSQPYILICDKNAQKQILSLYIRIGYFNCQGYNNFDMKNLVSTDLMDYPLLRNYKELGDSEKKFFVDIRTPEEWKRTGVIKGAMFFGLKKLVNQEENEKNGVFQKLRDIQKRKLIIVHCKQGLRSKFATSILLRHKIYPVVLSQDVQDFSSLGLKMISPEQNEKYFKQHQKRQKQKDYDSEQQNKQQKMMQSQNMNRMQVERCYEQCLKKKDPKECEKQCKDKAKLQTKETMDEEIQMNQQQFQSTPNMNQQAASHQSIKPKPSPKASFQSQAAQFLSKQSPFKLIQQKFKQTLDLFFNKKDFKEVISQLNKLLESDPQNSQLFINRSLSHLQLGNLQKAFEDIQKAIQKDYLNPFGYFNLASMHLLKDKKALQGEKTEKTQMKDEAKQQKRDQKTIKNQNSQIEQQPQSKHHIHPKKKLEALKNIYSSLSCLYLKKGQKSQQIKDYDLAIQYAPNNIDALVGRSYKLWQNGQLKQSYQDVKKANQLTEQKNQTIRNILDKMKSFLTKFQKNPEIQKPQFLQQSQPKREQKQSQTKKQTQSISINPQHEQQLAQTQQKTKMNKQIWDQIPLQNIEITNFLPKKLIGKAFSQMEQFHKNIDKEIQQKIQQWNKLYNQLYDQQKVRKMFGQNRENIGQKKETKREINKTQL